MSETQQVSAHYVIGQNGQPIADPANGATWTWVVTKEMYRILQYRSQGKRYPKRKKRSTRRARIYTQKYSL